MKMVFHDMYAYYQSWHIVVRVDTIYVVTDRDCLSVTGAILLILAVIITSLVIQVISIGYVY